MLNLRSIQAVRQATIDAIFRRPLYETYCFSNIPGTIKGLLTGKKNQGLPEDTVIKAPSHKYECVVMILIDGFGWQFLMKYLEETPFLRRFLEHGIISQITSQFPSTTVPHLTCLNTGLSVGQSGLFDWFYYEPLVNAIIAPFRYAFAGESNHSLCSQSQITPQEIFPFSSFYDDLKHQGICSTLFYHRSYAHSPFSQLTGKGATIVPYGSIAEGIYKLAERILHQPKGYYYLYLGDIDSIGHQFGPDSLEVDRSIREMFQLLEKRLGNHPTLMNPNTALIMTSDHGQIATQPENTIYLNLLLPEVIKCMKKDFKGQPLAPAGSPRDYFLYLLEDQLEEAYQLIQSNLKGKARVYLIKELIDKGVFGNLPLSSRFYQRIGNLVILPYENETVFWYEENRFENFFKGNHGGLSSQEMDTIFLFKAG